MNNHLHVMFGALLNNDRAGTYTGGHKYRKIPIVGANIWVTSFLVFLLKITKIKDEEEPDCCEVRVTDLIRTKMCNKNGYWRTK